MEKNFSNTIWNNKQNSIFKAISEESCYDNDKKYQYNIYEKFDKSLLTKITPIDFDSFSIIQFPYDLDSGILSSIVESVVDNDTDDSLSLSPTERDKEPNTFVEVSTSDETIKRQNDNDFSYFESQNSKFLYLLHHTDFEDGFRTDLHDYFDKLFEKNKYTFTCWLNYFFSSNQSDVAVIEGLLRLIATVRIETFQKILLPIVRCGFTDKDVCIQEAAIMVAEKWRSEPCLEALERTQFNSGWVNDYANGLIKELKEELRK